MACWAAPIHCVSTQSQQGKYWLKWYTDAGITAGFRGCWRGPRHPARCQFFCLYLCHVSFVHCCSLTSPPCPDRWLTHHTLISTHPVGEFSPLKAQISPYSITLVQLRAQSCSEAVCAHKLCWIIVFVFISKTQTAQLLHIYSRKPENYRQEKRIK